MSKDKVLAEADERMKHTLVHAQHELASIRTSKATPALLDTVRVACYGSHSLLNQIALVSAPEPRLLVVQPYDRTLVKEVAKGIQASELGLNPVDDGSVIRVPIPALTEERRKDLVKHTRKLAEDYRVSVRNHRRDALEMLKELEKDRTITEDDRRHTAEKIEVATKEAVERLEKALKAKEDEIMAV